MTDATVLHKLEGYSAVLARFLNGFGVAFLAVMMLVTTVDVLSRFFFNLPVTGSIEITEFLLLLTIFLGLPHAAAQDRHINIDFLTSRFSERAQFWLDSLMSLIGLSLFVALVWRSIVYLQLMGRLNRTTAVLQIPISPMVLVVIFGFGLLGLVVLLKLLVKLQNGLRNWKQWLIYIVAAAVILLAIYFLATQARGLPFKLTPITAGIAGMLLLFILFLCGLPVMHSLILVGVLGMMYLRGLPAGFSIMGSSPFDTASSYTFSVIPLFVLMGEFCFFSGLGADLYQMAYRWVGALPGGISMGTIMACGGFAAVCGDSMATAVTMGTVALPEMKKFNYDDKLAIGCVAAGGTLGVLIPPSLAFILYALLADQSIATLFIAGILPGILLITLFMLTVYVQTRINPALGPAGPRTTFREKLSSLKGVWATLALFVLVIGGMYAGIFTPTEGGGMGAFGAMVIGLVRRRLNLKRIWASLIEAAMISAVCIGVLIGANMFGYFLAASKLPLEMAGYVAQLAVPPLVILILILIIYLFLGCLMPAIPMLILTVPIFYPVITTLGFDPVWYGVVMVLMFEMAVITPPMGINVLALQVVTKDVPLSSMFRGTMPFLLAMIICVGLIIAVPDIALVLPGIFD
jgi:tripartite ATP-independent transporter DctM subunit